MIKLVNWQLQALILHKDKASELAVACLILHKDKGGELAVASLSELAVASLNPSQR